jgi:hypothetical protein
MTASRVVYGVWLSFVVGASVVPVFVVGVADGYYRGQIVAIAKAVLQPGSPRLRGP